MPEKLENKAFLDTQLSPEQLAAKGLDSFVGNPGLAELAALFGVEELPQDRTEKLAALQKIAAERWDLREGAERQAVEWNHALLDQEGSEQWKIVFEAADKLGLVSNTEPVNKHPNSLVILGGANRAPFDRLRYGLESVEDFDQLVYLGSSRPVSDDERKIVADYAPEAKTEYDLGTGAFAALLGATLEHEISIERDGDIWGMSLYSFEHNGETKPGLVLNTPRLISGRRTTTYDNYDFFARQAELAKDPNHTVVAVTTGLYTASQHFRAIRKTTLPYGTRLETIGHCAEYSGAVRKPSQLLQETKAAIDAAVRIDSDLKSM